MKERAGYLIARDLDELSHGKSMKQPCVFP
jgi:hypothetical protein